MSIKILSSTQLLFHHSLDNDSSSFCPVLNKHWKYIAKTRYDYFCTNIKKAEQENGKKTLQQFTWNYHLLQILIQNLNKNNIFEEHLKILCVKVSILKVFRYFSVQWNITLMIYKSVKLRHIYIYKCYLQQRNRHLS